MTDDSKCSPKKPSTRSSIRISLGKALADVINKESRDATKNSKKARRSSVISSIPAPRASMGDVRPPSQVSKRTSTPESKVVTRRRVSASIQRSSSEEQSVKNESSGTPGASSSSARGTSLRPRTNNATSALPKYRPKSTVDVEKPPSPIGLRAGTRRRLSTSEDEGKKEQKPPTTALSPEEKGSRPISPLPQRAALKANLTNSINSTPPATPTKTSHAHPTTPSSAKYSPSRPAKIIKTTPGATALPRPPSSSSASIKNATPHTSTPKGLKPPFNASRSNQETAKPRATPDARSPAHPMRNTPSPLAHRSKKISKSNILPINRVTNTSASSSVGNMSHISEGNSDDDDDENVALLLAPAAPLGAPTPAMPRIQRTRKRVHPQTPSKTVASLPTRANLSYGSPNFPRIGGGDGSSLLLRPPQQSSASRTARTSIMSWEQLADEASRTLPEEEITRMLADVPAPFRSGPASPALSSMDIPESPALSAIDSPGGYGSISQVLLPDVTPSPAFNSSTQHSRFSLSPDGHTVESSTVTLIRLQLAAAENQAKERLFQLQAMEEEIFNLKQVHAHQAEEIEKHLNYIDAQHRQVNEERAAVISSLQEDLRHADHEREKSVQEATRSCRQETKAAAAQQFEAVCSARVAASEWKAAQSACQIELETIQGDKAVLSVLLTELDQLRQTLMT